MARKAKVPGRPVSKRAIRAQVHKSTGHYNVDGGNPRKRTSRKG